MARRLSGTGYYVMLPNLYYRDVPSFTVHREDPGSREYMFSLMANLTNALVAADAATMIEHAASDSAADASCVGVTGYCMSGPYALAAASRYPDLVAAAASFYGTWLVSDAEESPHLTFAKTKGEIYIACAEHDDLAPMPMVSKLEKAFQQSRARGEIEIYSKVHHGFAFPQRWCYDKTAAEQHWERLVSLYHRNLG